MCAGDDIASDIAWIHIYFVSALSEVQISDSSATFQSKRSRELP